MFICGVCRIDYGQSHKVFLRQACLGHNFILQEEKFMKKTLLKIAAKAAEKSAVKSANTACLVFTYQPKAPKGIKSFKK